MPQHNCPSADSLRDFAIGCSEGGEYEAIAEHVEVCPVCLSQLEILDQSVDPLVDQLQKLSITSAPKPTAEQQFWASAIISGKARSGSNPM